MMEADRPHTEFRCRIQKIAVVMFGGKQWRMWLLLPACLLLCLVLYYTAALISEYQFRHTLEEIEAMQPETRAGQNVFYFNMLDAREQYLYDAIAEAVDVCSTQTKILPFVPTEDEFSNAFRAFLCDRPDLCGLIPSECAYSASTYTSAVQLFYQSQADMQRAELDGIVNAMVKKAQMSSKTEYETALLLHDALIDKRILSDGPSNKPAWDTSAYDVLTTGGANGFGYAAAYKLLCNRAGISCEIVLGKAGTDDSVWQDHAWNCVTADGSIGYTDVLWDDCAIDGDMLPFHGYFMLVLSEMTKDHQPETSKWWRAGDAKNYYIAYNCYAKTEEDLSEVLYTLLTDARQHGSDNIELQLPGDITDYMLKGYYQSAVAAVNAADDKQPRLRTDNRIYRASDSRPVRTIRLFYEADDST